MHKRHASGATKRKAADEKKRKEDLLLKGVPKISNFLKATSSSEPASADAESSSTNKERSASPPAECVGDLKCEPETTETFPIISNDAALWRMETSLDYLQAHWAKHGWFILL